MLLPGFVGPDHLAQESLSSSGTEIVVNLDGKAFSTDEGTPVRPVEFAVSERTNYDLQR